MQPALGSTNIRASAIVHVPDAASGLYKVRPITAENGKRLGVVINITEIWRPVDVVPSFGMKCPLGWTKDSSVELAENLYVNTYFDKSIHRSFLKNGGNEVARM